MRFFLYVPSLLRPNPSGKLFTVDNLMRLPLAFGITYMTSPAVFFPPPRRLPSTVTAELLYLKQKAECRIPRLDSENPT